MTYGISCHIVVSGRRTSVQAEEREMHCYTFEKRHSLHCMGQDGHKERRTRNDSSLRASFSGSHLTNLCQNRQLGTKDAGMTCPHILPCRDVSERIGDLRKRRDRVINVESSESPVDHYQSQRK